VINTAAPTRAKTILASETTLGLTPARTPACAMARAHPVERVLSGRRSSGVESKVNSSVPSQTCPAHSSPQGYFTVSEFKAQGKCLLAVFSRTRSPH
jgi:hypothetical protein